MGALRPAVAAVAVAAVAIVVLLLAHGGSAPAVEPAAPVAVRASLDESAVQFGDAVTARVVVNLDRSAVRVGTLRVTSNLAPFSLISTPVRLRSHAGSLETVTIVQRAACITELCLARRIALPRVRVTVSARDGSTVTESAAWRRVVMRSRVSPADLAAATPRFAADVAPGTPTYRVTPGTAGWILELVAALAAAGAAALLVLELAGVRRRRRRVAEADELQRALRLARDSRQRPVADRRRALALVSRLLRSREGTLSTAASELAWSEPAPEPPAVDDLVESIEKERAG
jgi:hypothetical protein